MLGETADEIREREEARRLGDFADGLARVDEQLLGLFDAVAGQVVERRTAERLLHAEGDVIGVKMQLFRQRLVAYLLPVMAAQVGGRFVRQRQLRVFGRGAALLLQMKQELLEQLLLPKTILHSRCGA